MSPLAHFITKMGCRIIEGSESDTSVYGPNARSLDFPSVTIIFDSVTEEIYEIQAYPDDYENSFLGRIFWVHPDYEVAERLRRKALPSSDFGDQCYSVDAIMMIAEAATFDREWDHGLVNEITLIFDEEDERKILQAAEIMGVSLSEFMNIALVEHLAKLESEKPAKKSRKKAK